MTKVARIPGEALTAVGATDRADRMASLLFSIAADGFRDWLNGAPLDHAAMKCRIAAELRDDYLALRCLGGFQRHVTSILNNLAD